MAVKSLTRWLEHAHYRKRLTFQGPHLFVTALTFRPDGRLLVSCDESRGCLVFEVGTWQVLGVLPERIWGAVFSPDGRYLATCSDISGFHIWEVRDSKPWMWRKLPVNETGEKLSALKVAWSPDQRYLAVCGKKKKRGHVIEIWRADNNPFWFFNFRDFRNGVHALNYEIRQGIGNQLAMYSSSKTQNTPRFQQNPASWGNESTLVRQYFWAHLR